MIIDLNECIKLESIEDDFGYEIFIMPPLNEKMILEHSDFDSYQDYLLLNIDEFNNKKFKVLTLEDTIKWCLKNDLNELFEEKFKEDLFLTDLKLIN